MYNLMLKRREFLRAQIEECLRIIGAAPPGKLEIHKNNTTTRFYVKPDNGPRYYLPKAEMKTAELLARKRIMLTRLSFLEKELRATELYLKHYPREVLRLESGEKEVQFLELISKPVSLPWHLQPFNSNTAFSENLRHPSPSGHMLRSKSECLIDMELFYRSIPFRYECELKMPGTTMYPDFTFFSASTGEFKYWEHFGMMDDPLYRRKAFDKIETYISYGFVPDENVLFTYETANSPLTMTTIDRKIDEIAAWLNL